MPSVHLAYTQVKKDSSKSAKLQSVQLHYAYSYSISCITKIQWFPVKAVHKRLMNVTAMDKKIKIIYELAERIFYSAHSVIINSIKRHPVIK